MTLDKGFEEFPGIAAFYGEVAEVGSMVPIRTEGVPGPMGPRGVPGVDGADAYGFGGMFVEYDDGMCFTANPHTDDCGCPESYTPLLMLISGATGYGEPERLMYLCY